MIHDDLIRRLQDEADQCRQDGADDIANLIDDAATALAGCNAAIQARRESAALLGNACDERDALRAELERLDESLSRLARESETAQSIGLDLVHENDRLRAELAALREQEPVLWRAEWEDGWSQYHDKSDPVPAEWGHEPPLRVIAFYAAPVPAEPVRQTLSNAEIGRHIDEMARTAGWNGEVTA